MVFRCYRSSVGVSRTQNEIFLEFPVPGEKGQPIDGRYLKQVDDLYASGKIGVVSFTILGWYYHSGFQTDIKKPPIYFIPYIVLIAWLIGKKLTDDPVIVGFAFGGFQYLLAHLFIGCGDHFRHVWWSVICSLSDHNPCFTQ